MGIRGFMDVIKENAPQAYRPISMAELRGKKLAIDANLFIWRFLASPADVENKHLQYTSDMVDFLRFHGVEPIFVFDGGFRTPAKVKVAHRKRAEVTERNRVHVNVVLASLDRHQTIHEILKAESPTKETSPAKSTSQQPTPPPDTMEDLIQSLGDLSVTAPSTSTGAKKALEETLKSGRAAALHARGNTTNMPRPAAARLDQEMALYDSLQKDTNSPTCLQTLAQKVETLQEETQRLQLRLARPDNGTFAQVQRLLSYLGVPYIISEDYVEAEQLCALLVQHQFADAVASEDTDVAVFLPEGKVIRNLFRWHKQPQELDTGLARQHLALSNPTFVDFCILCGCDFSGTIAQIGPKRALKHLRLHKSVDRLLVAQPALALRLSDDWDLEGARSVFTSQPMTADQLRAVYEQAMDTESRRPEDSLADYLAAVGIEPFTEERRQQYGQ
ncbi:hypothetical protein RI367_006900 [Sorochytrium milnesiophthora]